jgi:hypothetical protein
MTQVGAAMEYSEINNKIMKKTILGLYGVNAARWKLSGPK